VKWDQNNGVYLGISAVIVKIMPELRGSLIGTHVSLVGFFVAWLFKRSSLFYLGVLLVLAGTIIVLYNSYYR